MQIKIVTNNPVATESYDHIEPKGTAVDNLQNRGFIRAIVNHFGGPENVFYLDLGTAGGGIVQQFVEANVGYAIGVDGSDYSLIRKRAAWDIIPDNLFTADITKPFSFVNEDTNPVKFNIISSFDVLEHIHEHDLPALIENIKNNLFVGGYFLSSIAEFTDEGYHVTLKPAQWWIDLFEANGFVHEEIIRRDQYARNSSHDLTFKRLE